MAVSTYAQMRIFQDDYPINKSVSVGACPIKSLHLRLLMLNIFSMKSSRKTVAAILCSVFLLACTSCHRGSGCPVWTKAKYEQTAKKSV